MIRRFFRDERGATAIEYAIICSFLFIAIVTSIHIYIGSATDMYQRISDAIVGAGDDS